MFRLILKDYKTQKTIFLIYGICAGLASFLYCMPVRKVYGVSNQLLVQSPVMALIIYITLYLLINYLFYTDYRYDAIKLLVTLPLSRKRMAGSKYIEALILVISPVIIFVITAGFILIANLGITTDLFNEKLKVLISYCSTFLVLFSLNIPWYFKFEYTKAIYLNAYISSSVMLVLSPVLLLGQMTDNNLPEPIKSLVADIPKIDTNMIILMVLSSIVLYFLSLKISIILFSKKDLF